MEAVNDPYLAACLDIGHAEMSGLNTSAVQMILTLGTWLKALHIHDTDLHHDSHQIPFSMKIDYQPIMKALKTIGYQGWFTLEADAYLGNYSGDDIPKEVCALAAAAKRLEQMFNEA